MAMVEILIGLFILRELRRLIRSSMRSAIYLARKDEGPASHVITLRDGRRTA